MCLARIFSHGKHSTGRIEAKESIEGESDATKVSSVKLNGMLF